MITVNIFDSEGETYKKLLHKEMECEELRQQVFTLQEENMRLQRLCDMKDEILRKGSGNPDTNVGGEKYGTGQVVVRY